MLPPIKVFRIFYRESRKFCTTLVYKQSEDPVTDNYVDEVLTADSDYNELVNHCVRLGDIHNCLVIQPYVKWGPQKLLIKPAEQLEEAIALIKTLPSWTVEDTISVPLESLEKKSLFRKGYMETLTKIFQANPQITAVFINTGHLKKVTNIILQEKFGLPILDRYKIVMQILKLHAVSKHAKLQVALAELYFVQKTAQRNLLFFSKDPEVLKLMFQEREQKLKRAIHQLRSQRSLLRNKRRKLDYPVIAVVGYTNAGKTCLIKALTGEKSLQPRNQLFATLDVTVHSGILPSGLKVLYVDTVGFLSDIPTNLIECFVATLEDAVLADVIIHVEDLSSSCFEYKRKHVLSTLKNLSIHTDSENIMEKVISVGNKMDVANISYPMDLITVSAKKGTGLEDLRNTLEKTIMKRTGRKILIVRVANGGEEMTWLFKNSTVVSEMPDKKDQQIMEVKTIITESNLQKFKYHFIRNKLK
nr:putative GTP-binding protein 6 [Leptinotarsa decemlineata]